MSLLPLFPSGTCHGCNPSRASNEQKWKKTYFVGFYKLRKLTSRPLLDIPLDHVAISKGLKIKSVWPWDSNFCWLLNPWQNITSLMISKINRYHVFNWLLYLFIGFWRQHVAKTTFFWQIHVFLLAKSRSIFDSPHKLIFCCLWFGSYQKNSRIPFYLSIQSVMKSPISNSMFAAQLRLFLMALIHKCGKLVMANHS